ncbi:MAG TPA: helix-turn-helix transcriptional regulator, partial [Thermomicrobiales bacterium]|nr:helix-turn-helix transcriptional regulator [Thermomicrobiales bacterium]
RDRGNWTRALSLYKEALAIGRTDQAKRIVIEVIESVAMVAAHANHLERSAVLLGAAEGLRERIGLRYRPPRNRSFLERTIEATRLGLSAEMYAAAWQTGRNYFEGEAIAAALDFNDRTVQPATFALTARESEILRLLATGMTDPEIADALFISVRTVEHHVASVYRKLDVRTRSAATSTAIAAGIVASGGSG